MARQFWSALLQHPARRLVWLSLFLITLVLFLFVFFAGGSTALPGPEAGESAAGIPSSISLSSRLIANATLGFERIFAINLPERSDHRDGLVLATAVSNITVEFVEGIHGDKIPAKVLPPNFNQDLNPGSIGSWRAHMNAIRRVVETGASTALIIEDDVDWDVRLRTSLDHFATASRSLHTLDSSDKINFRDLPPTQVTHSPYGEGWDVLWLGHCGMNIPGRAGLVVMENDETVPEVQYLKSFEEAAWSPLSAYPQHTRVFMQQTEGTCSLAYAVSQTGARGILNDLGLNRLTGPFDNMLRGWCAGLEGSSGHLCFGVLPQLFDHFRREGSTESDSDISAPSSPYRDKARTLNIRWSVRLNMNKILRGDTNYDDQWPDS
ncbi:hypothetical protein PV04_00248 [Phialophora macrospora]|uniref:LPS glycosyltransferase n=1 Tax=Phialophora macrospora TaxID=1851006 RepID=A0A0D2GI79_9EURO|nr:hypothetical protein PV04_00248 [Phialophora macrospora]